MHLLVDGSITFPVRLEALKPVGLVSKSLISNPELERFVIVIPVIAGYAERSIAIWVEQTSFSVSVFIKPTFWDMAYLPSRVLPHDR